MLLMRDAIIFIAASIIRAIAIAAASPLFSLPPLIYFSLVISFHFSSRHFLRLIFHFIDFLHFRSFSSSLLFIFFIH
jgi:hypothetical protein